MKLKHLTFLALLGAPLIARAHYLWIESDTPAEARVYFGEIQEGVREKAGGRLEERAGLQVTVESKGAPARKLETEKKPDHFQLQPKVEGGWLLAQDTAGEVKDWTKSDLGVVKPVFYARAAIANQPTAAKPTLPLDVIPDPADPHVVRVYFKQQPLAKAKVLVYAPNTWLQELATDENGQVKIATPWPGRYVLDVIHKERVPGEFQGKAYEAIRHRATLTQNY